jgi:hypothetical protein
VALLLVVSALIPLVGDAPASAQGLTTYTTPLSLRFEQNFTTSLHIDIPPSPFTFYPNGTIKLTNGAVSLKFNVIPIPFQAPTSFQANSTYVVYSEKGPGPNCYLNWAFKEGKQSNNQGNTALVQMYGTAAQPCAMGATISIILKAYGSQLQALNSTQGTTGSLCDVSVASIEWNFCPAVSTLTNVGLTYSAGTIQLKTTATAWSWVDPIALDGYCSGTATPGLLASCGLTTAKSPDVIVVFVGSSSNSGSMAVSGDSLTWYSRATANVGGSNNAEWEFCAIASGTLSSSSLITASWTGSFYTYMIAFGVSGANTGGCTSGNSYDSNGAAPATNFTAGTTNIIGKISTSNANDMLIGGFVSGGSPSISSTFAHNIVKTSGKAGSADYTVESSTVTNLKTKYTVDSSLNLAVIVDAIQQASSSINYVFTITNTLSVTPSVQNKVVHDVTATVSIAPSVMLAVVHSVAAAVSITPSVGLSIVHDITETVSIAPSVALAVVHQVVASISITPEVACLKNFGACMVSPSGGVANFALFLFLTLFVGFIIVGRRYSRR